MSGSHAEVPALRISSSATAEEVAAVVAVLLQLGGGEAEPRTPRADRWAASARPGRPTVPGWSDPRAAFEGR
ncbi:acyl-CoA carboxylase epsilon subunit [Nakamurella leprariae]|uniref:Acyl-CoA carboxylase subunit epsilon n=1 Tax=Nakamurella leprariae TaxID=2803911 RepID=A0A938YGG9_9ACTN|nr:acyl-CoA carboxylase epsilon subunit [Nakamurella leprariae]MBM9469071.1 hypothetical protein [Nakamurella leprariae]